MTPVTQTESTDLDPISILNRLTRVLLRNVRLMTIIFVSISAAIYLTLMFTSNQYDSAAQILVKLGRENTQVPVTVEKGDVFSTGIQKEEVHSYMRLLLSNEIINQTIDELGVERFTSRGPHPDSVLGWIKYGLRGIARWGKNTLNSGFILVGLKPRLDDREKVFKLLKRNLQVVREKDSNVISVFIRLGDPNLARDVIAKVIELYKVAHVKVNGHEQMIDVFEEQATSDKLSLSVLEEKIETLKQQKGLSLPQLQIQTLIQNIQNLKNNRDLQVIRRAELSQQKNKLTIQLRSLPTTQVRTELKEVNPTAALLRSELGKLKLRRAQMTKSYRPDSEMVREITDMVNDLEILLEKESGLDSTGTTTQPNPLAEEIDKKIKSIDVELDGLRAGIPKTEEAIGDIENEIQTIRLGNIQLEELQREFSVIEKKYLTTATRYERIKTEQALDDGQVANISILSEASFSTEPASPKRLLLMVLGIIFALVSAVGFVLFRDWLIQTIYDEEDLKEISGVKFLGSYRLNEQL